jgi:hypothetical protein
LEFQDFIFFDFNQSPTFASIPTLGASYDNSLIGYWNLDENIGSIAKATGSNDTSLLLSNPAPTWVNGKYNSALKLLVLTMHIFHLNRPFLLQVFRLYVGLSAMVILEEQARVVTTH